MTKGKSMITEEIGLNAHLEQAGLQVTETDLGEYLIQIRGETPSHIIAPAIHLTQAQIVEDFRRLHAHLPKDRRLDEPAQLVDEARTILRERFLTADVGITGANFLIAETGTSVIVTNEGNGDLTQSLSKMHIVVASIEKLVPTLEDTATLLRVLARSATGQEISTYTTFSTGPRRSAGATPDPDGPEAYHVVILDNGRSELARHRSARSLALHSLRRLHEPLPRLWRHRRPCLRLGLSRPDRLGADPVADRRQDIRRPAARLDLLRPLRGGLPRAHPLAETAALLARRKISSRAAARRSFRIGFEGVGLDGASPPALSLSVRGSACRCSPGWAARAAPSSGCHWPAAGRGIAICQRRKAGTFQAQWKARQAAKGARP